MSKCVLFGFLSLFTSLIVGCATVPPPNDEYALAYAAIEWARAQGAPRYSPGNWHRAEESYRRGIALFEDRHYDEAREFFIRAKLSAERAENSARVLKFQRGEVF